MYIAKANKDIENILHQHSYNKVTFNMYSNRSTVYASLSDREPILKNSKDKSRGTMRLGDVLY